MTTGTLAGEMVGRRGRAVATDTISKPGVVEGGPGPGGGGVATGTLAGEMVDGRGRAVATSTVGKPRVVEGGNGPIVGAGVARGTFTRVMVDRFVFLVAGGALGNARVTEGGHEPIVGIGVARDAFPLKMVYGFVFDVAGRTFVDADVIELVRFPIGVGDVMAVGAGPVKVVRWGLVATFTFGGGVIVCALRMARFTGYELVFASEGVEAVVYVLVEERDGLWADRGDEVVVLVQHHRNTVVG